uniref:Uncharacterized protein n=1 Tax=Picea glauca TaxID=3330 RepID=A0A101M0C2_PICGL|nr:hypothetical protein ABT39_MTgene4671 [Picea glauca]QHR91273.1 hypothetical protein Q903MT_gene5305 [Picea sitchensis]
MHCIISNWYLSIRGKNPNQLPTETSLATARGYLVVTRIHQVPIITATQPCIVLSQFRTNQAELTDPLTHLYRPCIPQPTNTTIINLVTSESRHHPTITR